MFHSPQLQACINRFAAARSIPFPATMPRNLIPVTGVNWYAGQNQSQVRRELAVIPMGKAADLATNNNPNFDTFGIFNQLVV